jgi:hypothetical protein
MLFCSSKRAVTSISTATCFPRSAACSSARTTGESTPVR